MYFSRNFSDFSVKILSFAIIKLFCTNLLRNSSEASVTCLFLEQFSQSTVLGNSSLTMLKNLFILLFLLSISTGFSQEVMPDRKKLMPRDSINNLQRTPEKSRDSVAEAADRLHPSLQIRSVDPQTGDEDPQFMIIKGDTIPREFIGLDEVVILERLKFDNLEERRRYLILKRRTHKVFPYASLAADRLVELNARLERLESKRDQKRYIRIVQNYIEGEFKEELKKLTRSEGQILVKLVHRQTGITTFDLIKDLRSGWNAFWYNTTASMFDISLKEEFRPQEVEEDYLIEDILQRAFQARELERQPTVLDFD